MESRADKAREKAAEERAMERLYLVCEDGCRCEQAQHLQPNCRTSHRCLEPPL